MHRLLWNRRLRPWFGRRWGRPLTGLVASSAIALPASGLLLAVLPHTEQPLYFSLWAGLVVGCAFSILQITIAMTVAMRCPQAVRIAMTLSIVALATALTWFLPLESRMRRPLILAVCSGCLGSLLVSLVFCGLSRRSLVAPGGYSLGSSSQRFDIWLLVSMIWFFTIQYDEYYSRFLSSTLGDRFLWSCAAAGSATAGSFLVLSRFRNRLLAYLIAMPVVLVALWIGSERVHEYMYFPLPRRVFAVVVIAAGTGWILAQESVPRLLDLCNWKWRTHRRIDLWAMSAAPADSHPPASRSKIARLQNSWRVLAALFLMSLFSGVLASTLGAWIPFRSRQYFEAMLTPTVAASAISLVVLAAHQLTRLWALCLALAVFLLVLVSMFPEFMNDIPRSIRYGILGIPIPVATAIYGMIRLADQQGRYTIGVVKRVREPISIRELMGGTLILGVEFSLMNASQVDIVPLAAMTCAALFLCLISIVWYRGYFIGVGRRTWIASGFLLALYLAAVYLDRSLASKGTLFMVCLFLGWHWLIAQSLRRNGWSKIAV